MKIFFICSASLTSHNYCHILGNIFIFLDIVISRNDEANQITLFKA